VFTFEDQGAGCEVTACGTVGWFAGCCPGSYLWL